MLTKIFAKILGFWIVLAVLGLIIARQSWISALNALFADPALVWVTGVFTVLVGLTIVVLHNRWSGGALPIIVSIYGWIALLKGLSLVWLPPAAAMAAWQALHFDRFYLGYVIVALAVGAYLVYGGFTHEEPTVEVVELAVTPDTWPTVPHVPPRG